MVESFTLLEVAGNGLFCSISDYPLSAKSPRRLTIVSPGIALS